MAAEAGRGLRRIAAAMQLDRRVNRDRGDETFNLVPKERANAVDTD
jgi:hypothetical protein